MRLFVGIAVQPRLVADDPTFALREPDGATTLGGLPRLAFAHKGGGGLKQTNELLAGRHLFALQDAPGRLRDDLLDQWDALVNGPHDALRRSWNLDRQPLLHVRGTGHDRGGQSR